MAPTSTQQDEQQETRGGTRLRSGFQLTAPELPTRVSRQFAPDVQKGPMKRSSAPQGEETSTGENSRTESSDVQERSGISTPAASESERRQLEEVASVEQRIVEEPRNSAKYPNYADDPDPLPDNATKAAKTARAKETREYSQSMFAMYSRTKMRGKSMWLDFITAFRPHTIRTWNRAFIREWRELLMTRDVFVDKDRTRAPVETLIDLLYREKHMSRTEGELSQGESLDGTGEDTGESLEQERDELQPQQPLSATKPAEGATADANRGDTPSVAGFQEDVRELDVVSQGYRQNTQMDPEDPDDGDESGSDKEPANGRRPQSRPFRQTERHQVREEKPVVRSSTSKDQGRVVANILKAYVGQPTFSGLYDEDLETIANIYSNVAEMCDATPEDKSKAMSVMLKGAALALFTRNARGRGSFEEGMDTLRSWYNSNDKQARLLAEWQSLSLSSALEERPHDAEVTVFRAFVDRLMSLQNQLHPDYNTDRQLRDRLVNAVDIPRIQDSLRDRTPRTAQQLINRVANRLSTKKHSAGGNAAHLATENDRRDMEDEKEANYTLGQEYGGEAERNVKLPGSSRRGTRIALPKTQQEHGVRRPTEHTHGHGRGNRDRRVVKSNWMRGVRGCFVCGRSHRANEHHPRDEVTAAINRLKARHPRALITVDDLAFLANNYLNMDEDDDEEEDPEADVAEDDIFEDEE